MIKNIIFDIGGVVIIKSKFDLISRYIVKKIFTNYNRIKEETIKEDLKHIWTLWRVGKITEDKFFEVAKEKTKIKLPIFYLKKKFYSAHKENKKIILLIKKLKQKYNTYALTNHAKEWFEVQSEELRFNDLFDGVVTSFEERIPKPDIKIYQNLLQKYNLNPKECIFIDDQKENLTPAKKLGMKTIHYKDFSQLTREMRKHGVI